MVWKHEDEGKLRMMPVKGSPERLEERVRGCPALRWSDSDKLKPLGRIGASQRTVEVPPNAVYANSDTSARSGGRRYRARSNEAGPHQQAAKYATYQPMWHFSLVLVLTPEN